MAFYDHNLAFATLVVATSLAQTGSMKTYTYEQSGGVPARYIERKHYGWLLSLLWPLAPIFAISLHVLTGNPNWLWIPLAIGFVAVPLLDYLVGEDTSNPPETVVPDLESDPYYRNLTIAVVPLHFVTFLASAWWVGSQALPWPAFIGLALAAGAAGGLAINTAHELGHKYTPLEKALAWIVLSIPAYGHFCVEHNRGHHKHVATPGDPASARLGESIYRFALREIPGAFVRAWRIESDRLRAQGKRPVHWDNPIVKSWLLTLVMHGTLIGLFGWPMVAFLAIHNVFAWWQLTSANYIEHYGLKRIVDENGRVERCQPHHSWNSNHTVSNLLLFHLQRHSDHHAHPTRRYQSLRDFSGIPRLPSGYSGMFLIAYVPWLWYRVMDQRLMALPHIQGDMERINTG